LTPVRDDRMSDSKIIVIDDDPTIVGKIHGFDAG
jgi:hypothetical protein